MIRTVASCPYCAAGVIAIDDGPRVVINPDVVNDTPCRHTAFYWISLTAEAWNWQRVWLSGSGTVRGRLDFKCECLLNLSLGMEPDFRPRIAYRIVGGTASDRDDARSESGHFLFNRARGCPVSVIFDGFAIYALNPAALLEELQAFELA